MEEMALLQLQGDMEAGLKLVGVGTVLQMRVLFGGSPLPRWCRELPSAILNAQQLRERVANI
jgi:hypothetical protein